MLKWILGLFRRRAQTRVWEQHVVTDPSYWLSLRTFDARIEAAKRAKKKHSHILKEKQDFVHACLRGDL